MMPSLLKSATAETGEFAATGPVIYFEVESAKVPSPLLINNKIFVLLSVCRFSPPTNKSSRPSPLKSYFAKYLFILSNNSTHLEPT